MPLVDAESVRSVVQMHYSRDFKTQITPNVTQRNTLIAAGCYIVVIAILWYVAQPYMSLLLLRVLQYLRHVPFLSWISESTIFHVDQPVYEANGSFYSISLQVSSDPSSSRARA